MEKDFPFNLPAGRWKFTFTPTKDQPPSKAPRYLKIEVTILCLLIIALVIVLRYPLGPQFYFSAFGLILNLLGFILLALELLSGGELLFTDRLKNLMRLALWLKNTYETKLKVGITEFEVDGEEFNKIVNDSPSELLKPFEKKLKQTLGLAGLSFLFVGFFLQFLALFFPLT